MAVQDDFLPVQQGVEGGSIEVCYGSHRLRVTAGLQVGEVKERLWDRLSLCYFCIADVNFCPVNLLRILLPNDRLTFWRMWGYKGGGGVASTQAEELVRLDPAVHRIITEVCSLGLDTTQTANLVAARTYRHCKEMYGKPLDEALQVIREVGERNGQLLEELLRLSKGSRSDTSDLRSLEVWQTPSPAANQSSPYFTAHEAATFLRSTVQTIYDWKKKGLLHPVPGIRGKLLFSHESLVRFATIRRRR